MVAIVDIIAAKAKGEELVGIFVFFVIVAVIIAVMREAQKRGQQAAQRRPPPQPVWTPPLLPQVAPPPPANVSSASYNDVASQLAPEMVTMANARNLAPQAAKAQPRKALLGAWLKDRNDLRRALVLNEILGKPLSMRRK